MVRKRAEKSVKGIPANLVDLYRRGQRIRFHGFWLNDSARDRLIARWLDAQSNSAEAVKMLIFMAVSGMGAQPLPSIDYQDDQSVDKVARALRDMED